MKRIGKPVFFIVSIIIIAFTVLSFVGISNTYGDVTNVYIKGASDIRWGIDIRGGVDVTFSAPEGTNPTEKEMNAAAEAMRQRMVTLNITDSEVFTDVDNGRVIVRFPWREGEADFDPEAAIEELGATAQLTFREGYKVDEKGQPTDITENVILDGNLVEEASALYGQLEQNGAYEYYISLTLKSEGATKFAEATKELYEIHQSNPNDSTVGSISIWMDDDMISNATVNAVITDGKAVITGNFDSESANALANKINAGALPFALTTETYSTITPTLGQGALQAMLIAGIIAFVLICIFMILYYRLPGFIACLALIGHVGGMIASISGFLPGINSFTLTIPGIAGIILSIGMGVDANIITAERIKDEIHSGKSIDGSISSGFSRAFTAIFDGNITIVIVAIVLMGTFGAPSSIFAQCFKWLFFMFSASTQGSIFSFGYTLLVGVVLNFIFSVGMSKLMMKSLSRLKPFRKPWLYGGKKNEEN